MPVTAELPPGAVQPSPPARGGRGMLLDPGMDLTL